jgi:ABC-2 type transport system ATP-binding protein
MSAALEATALGKRYRTGWALRDCSLNIPAGRIVALVGPNGAGKTTLLHLAIGLLSPSAGEVNVFGWSPRQHPILVLSRVGFVAQDRPLYRRFTVTEMLRLGRELNPRWDQPYVEARLRRLRIPLDRQIGRLSGGQAAQVALALALGKRADLLLLDEPVVNLDPLARREFLRELVDAVATDGMSAVLSSHVIADLERVCDYLVILADGRVQVMGDIDDLLSEHKLLVGPRIDPKVVAGDGSVVEAIHTELETALLVKTSGRVPPPHWRVHNVSLEELVLAYLGNSEASSLPAPSLAEAKK